MSGKKPLSYFWKKLWAVHCICTLYSLRMIHIYTGLFRIGDLFLELLCLKNLTYLNLLDSKIQEGQFISDLDDTLWTCTSHAGTKTTIKLDNNQLVKQLFGHVRVILWKLGIRDNLKWIMTIKQCEFYRRNVLLLVFSCTKCTKFCHPYTLMTHTFKTDHTL